MKHRMYSVYDAKAEMHNTPMFVSTEAFAIRNFADVCNNPQHPMGQHPEDYHLYFLGEYDDDTGTINQDVIKQVCNGLALVKQEDLI